MSDEPIIFSADAEPPLDAIGQSFSMHEWRGSGPPYQHIHHADDEGWHVLAGTLRFRFGERAFAAGPGTTVFVPAGTPHTYEATEGTRYLLILTPRLRALIAELQAAPFTEHAAIMRNHDSELIAQH